MNLVVALLFSVCVAALSLPLGIAVPMAVAALVVTAFAIGRIVVVSANIDYPFLDFLVGFAIVSHVLMVCVLVLPDEMWPLPLVGCVAVPLAYGWYRGADKGWDKIGLSLLVAAFTFVWCRDLSPRLTQFHETGKLDFWVDLVVHATTVSQFSVPETLGRGMPLLADMSRPIYHVASYLPAAFISRSFGLAAIDATVLLWIPMGILIMSAGVACLGFALGGGWLAAVSLAALALIPNPEWFSLANGFLGFAWLLETAPGTPYALGIGCGAVALLVYWFRNRRPILLVAAFMLGSACALLRINVFVLLAPILGLGFLAGITKMPRGWRAALLAAAFIVMCVALAVLSRDRLRSDAGTFLFSYVEFVHLSNAPTRYDSLYAWLVNVAGSPMAALAGVGLVLVGTLGPWFAVFVVLGLFLWFRGKLEAADFIPLAAVMIASAFMILAPVPPNGDISEFRHRAGPLLVLLVCIWSLRFAGLVVENFSRWENRVMSPWFATAVAFVSIFVMSFTISSSRMPRMQWAGSVYGTQFDPMLFLVSSILGKLAGPHARFVVADQSMDARVIDTAAMLVSLSGVPAFISCPQSLLLRDDNVGREAARRMEVVAKINAASDLQALRHVMAAEEIAYYVVTSKEQAPYDAGRVRALWKSGNYAIYADH